MPKTWNRLKSYQPRVGQHKVSEKVSMKEIDETIMYQAIGWIQGKIEEISENNCLINIDSKSYNLHLRSNLLAQVEINQTYWFKVYPKYHFSTNNYSFQAAACSLEEPKDLEVKIPNIFILKGMYEVLNNSDKTVFSIYRNYEGTHNNQKKKYITQNRLRTLIPFEMKGRKPFNKNLEDLETKLFYQVLARFEANTNTFHFLRDIVKPTKERPRKLKSQDLEEIEQQIRRGILNKPTETKTKKTKKTKKTPQQQVIKEIIMLNGKNAEITIKFEERPEVPAEGKKVQVQIKGENGISVRAQINRKTLKKLVEKMDSYESWIGALTGKIFELLPDGIIELESAGIQVFERKSKAQKQENSEEIKKAV